MCEEDNYMEMIKVMFNLAKDENSYDNIDEEIDIKDNSDNTMALDNTIICN